MTSVLAPRRTTPLFVALVTLVCLLLARAVAGQGITFEINQGQHEPAVRFAARGPGFGFFFTTAGVVLSTRGFNVRIAFPGSNGAPIVSGMDELPGKANYLRGRLRHAWRTNIPTYARVLYRDLYPGIDLVYYGRERQLEYDFIVAPNADPAQIALRFEGADSVSINADGELVLRAGDSEIRQHKPVMYQQREGEGQQARQAIDGGYVLRDGREVGFVIGPYDRTRPLVIDPVLAISSYLGGTGTDIAERVAVDLFGNAYVTGSTTSPDFPVTNGGSPTSTLEDVFIAKLNRSGDGLVYATYLGGTGSDIGRDIAVNLLGQAYVTGSTNSADFPVVNAFQPLPGGLGDAFVARLSADGNALIYSTFLGGSRRDTGGGIALDFAGNAYLTGETASLDFPTTANAFQPEIAGVDPSTDAFVAKLTPSGDGLVYATYLGGGEPDAGRAIAVNAHGNAFITGVTGSGDFPVFQPFQPLALRGVSEAFVTKLSVDGSSLVYSSNLGGNRNEAGLDIAVDLFDRAIVVGSTNSTDFPTRRPLQRALGGTLDAADGFITIVNADGATLAFSTYFGGSLRDEITSVAVDFAQNVYVAGRTFSTDFPVVNPLQAHAGGGLDAIVAKIDASRNNPRLTYSTWLGGEGDDDGRGIAVDLLGSAYVVGTTVSDGFPTVHALQPDRAGGTDAFFAKITQRP
jgi:hypothetical protein